MPLHVPLKACRAASSALALAAMLAACGGDGESGASVSSAPAIAGTLTIEHDVPVAGSTPFISFVTLHGVPIDRLTSVNFVVVKQAGTVSKPVSVDYSRDYLERRGYARSGDSTLVVPIFGLYADTANTVQVDLMFDDESHLRQSVPVQTAPYVDPAGFDDKGIVVQARAPGRTLGFDFFYVKDGTGSPLVVDTDGHVRWVAAGSPAATSSIQSGDGFEVGEPNGNASVHVSFDGTIGPRVPVDLPDLRYFHHNLEIGKSGFLANIDDGPGGTSLTESTAIEYAADGALLHRWDLASILSDHMRANGDDPTSFVRPEVDWFHMNTAIYDARDDSVIVSSRENFIVKLDYLTGEIRWIFGDTTKYWYSFPSLRALSLTFVGGGLVPIGQHAISLTDDGALLLFNNGAASQNQPAGQPAGLARDYAAVSSYVIDESARTVSEQWHFDHDRTYASPFCSSARQTSDGSVLVDYAFGLNGTQTDIVGLDPSHEVVFDIRFPSVPCTLWNAMPIAFEGLRIE